MRMIDRFAMTLMMCLLVTAASHALTPIRDGERILWVGNSYSDWFGPITEVMKTAFTAAGAPRNVTFHQVVRGMGTFRIYHEQEDLHTLDSIGSGHFDRLVLQGWEDAYRNADGDGPASFVDYGTRIINAAKEQDIECVLFWPQFANWEWDDAQKINTAKNSYESVAAATGAFIAPAYKAWQQVIADRGLDRVKILLYHDVGHQGPNGMLLNMFVMYTVLTGGSSGVGLRSDWPGGITNSESSGDEYLPGEQDYLAGVAAQVGSSALGWTALLPAGARPACGAVRAVSPAIFAVDGRLIGRTPFSAQATVAGGATGFPLWRR